MTKETSVKYEELNRRIAIDISAQLNEHKDSEEIHNSLQKQIEDYCATLTESELREWVVEDLLNMHCKGIVMALLIKQNENPS